MKTWILCMNSQAPVLGEARTYCVRGASLDIDSECWSSNKREGKTRREHENEAVTGMMNKLMQKRKNIEPSGHDDRIAKPWEEPLLAAHDQAKLDLRAKKDFKMEAGRRAKEERRNCQRQRELQDLANCVGTGTMPGHSLRSSKFQKILRFSKDSIRVFRSQKIKHRVHPIAPLESKVMNPSAKSLRGCCTTPSGTPDFVLALMRDASERSIPGTNIPFAKVDSSKGEEEFGGALGNNYLNNCVVAGIAGGVDWSDSDSDSD